MEQRSETFGIVSGSGIFPILLAQNLKQAGKRVVAVAHYGETSHSLSDYVDRCVWIRLGQLGKIIKVLKKERASRAAFAGGISRVKMFRGSVLPDRRGLSLLWRVKSVKDDVILRALAEELESEGIEVVSGADYIKDCVPVCNQLTTRGLTEYEAFQAQIGWKAAKKIGEEDIGQTVVVSNGMVVAVEAVEGTDEAILRGGKLSSKRGAVVVKVSKPHQDLRLDLPTIGVGTIEKMKEAGATALILEKGKTMILDPASVIREADEAGIAIALFEEGDFGGA
ncbi:MAG: DUF1009 domain-containing protein [Candidatus Dadabacteria bacterium]|nr:MAG: DUF1009 domain-containing protein [Candidatus Dadabacteria bacterium]